MSDFPGGIPTAAPLDAVVSDRPVVLTNRDYHGVWVNSRALELAGITAATTDPPGGRIERDAAGAPVGMLQEQAMHLVLDRAPAPTHADRMDGIRAAEDYYFGLGITACQDALVDAEWQAAYEQLARAGDLRLRVRGALEWQPGGDERQLAELVERRHSGTVGRLACGTVKFFHDGVVENRTAAMLDPYLDARRPPHVRVRPRPVSAGRRSSGSCACATPRASASTSTPSATAPCASHWTRSRRRSAPTAGATPATSWRTSSSPTPTICPGFALSG